MKNNTTILLVIIIFLILVIAYLGYDMYKKDDAEQEMKINQLEQEINVLEDKGKYRVPWYYRIPFYRNRGYRNRGYINRSS